MTAPKSLAAYEDCEKLFEQAAETEKGIAVVLETAGMAVKFRQKMNAYRVLLRKQSKLLREPTDPQYGMSPYDAFELALDPKNDCRVLIRKYRMTVAKIEELEE